MKLDENQSTVLGNPVKLKNLPAQTIEWDADTLHANKFAFVSNFISKVYGSDYDQLIAKDPL